MKLRTVSIILTLAVVFTAVPGCDAKQKLALVSGQCLSGGKPFNPQGKPGQPTPPGDPGMRIIFTGTEGSNANTQYSASYDPNTGEFKIPGTSGLGIPPGKYKVGVYVGSLALPGAATSKMGMPPGGAFPKGGGPPVTNDDPAAMFGKESFKDEVTVPETGLTGYIIDMDKKPAR